MAKEPVFYSDELAEEILDSISDARVGIRKLCAANPHWPDAKTIMKWKRSYEDFGKRYARAKQDQIELIVDDIIEIADDKSGDVIIKKDRKGDDYEACDSEFVHRSRVRIDTRKWLAAKLLPRLYGDKIQIENLDPASDPAVKEAVAIANKIRGETLG